MGRKAGYLTIVPLCSVCHRLLHQVGKRSFESRFGLSLETQAKLTDMAWQRHIAGANTGALSPETRGSIPSVATV